MLMSPVLIGSLALCLIQKAMQAETLLLTLEIMGGFELLKAERGEMH